MKIYVHASVSELWTVVILMRWQRHTVQWERWLNGHIFPACYVVM